MSLQNIIITSSINSIATQSYGQKTYIASTEEQSFPIEHITGSQAGSFPNFVSNTNYTVDLIVNITQSWQGSTPSVGGDIPFTHNTMDEFYNGEFSGSRYVVTDGSLIDDDCKQFLTINTTPTNYSVFQYFVSSSDLTGQITNQFGVFINNLTVPPNGGILMFYESNTYEETPPTVNYKKITYLKISRFDKEGNDNTLSLQELTNIRWTDSTAGLIDLKILNIAEYPTYYLYTVSSKTWINTSYSDDNKLNYSLSASFSGPSASAGLMYLDNWTVHNVSGGTFDTFYYTFDVTPNFTTRYTASITAYNGNASPVTFDFNFVENTYVGTEIYFATIAQTQSVSIPSLQSKTFILSGSTNSSFIGNSAVQYHLETKGLNLPISLSNTFWIITQSVTPKISTSSIVIEPYLLSNFANSDCDVLMNNYSQNDISTDYREVLYDNGGNIPSNLQRILDNTAEFAQINDYIFSARSSTIPRFEGSRTTSQNINLPYIGGLNNEELSILDSSSISTTTSNLANVDVTTPYFAYFERISDGFPRQIAGSKLVITRLVDASGNSLPLDGSNTNLFSLENIFKPNTTASVFYIVKVNDSSSINNIETTITDVGADYKNIFYFKPRSGTTRLEGAISTKLLNINYAQGQSNPVAIYDYNDQFSSYDNILSLTTESSNTLSFKWTIDAIQGSGIFPPAGSSASPAPAPNPYFGLGYFIGLGLTLQDQYTNISNSYPNISSFPWIHFNPTSSTTTTADYDFDDSLFPIRAGDRIRVWNVLNGYNTGLPSNDRDILEVSQINLAYEYIDPNAIPPVYVEDKKINKIEIVQDGIYYPKYGPLAGSQALENYPMVVSNPFIVGGEIESIQFNEGYPFVFSSISSSLTSSINSIDYSNYHNKFIAVGDNGLIVTSSNGKDWHKLTISALPNLNEKLTKVSINPQGTIYIVGHNSLILSTNGLTTIESLSTSSIWNSVHPYPDSTYNFTSAYTIPYDTYAGGNQDVLIVGYNNIKNSGSIVQFQQPDGWASQSISKNTNINDIKKATNSDYAIAVGDNGSYITISDVSSTPSSWTLTYSSLASYGFSTNLNSVDYRYEKVLAVGDSGSIIYYDDNTFPPFNNPTQLFSASITTENLKSLKRVERDYIGTPAYTNYNSNFLYKYEDTWNQASSSAYFVVGENGFIAKGDDFDGTWNYDSWDSSSVGLQSYTLNDIAIGSYNSGSNSEVKLYLDSDIETSSFPYGTLLNNSLAVTLQGFRIYRGIPNDQTIYISDDIPDGVGFIVPNNYNPEYNYLEVAKKAGLISG